MRESKACCQNAALVSLEAAMVALKAVVTERLGRLACVAIVVQQRSGHGGDVAGAEAAGCRWVRLAPADQILLHSCGYARARGEGLAAGGRRMSCRGLQGVSQAANERSTHGLLTTGRQAAAESAIHPPGCNTTRLSSPLLTCGQASIRCCLRENL